MKMVTGGLHVQDPGRHRRRQAGLRPAAARHQDQTGDIDRALTIASAISADDRARALRWLRENADAFVDFDVLADREQAGP
jgi:hypothetical protein